MLGNAGSELRGRVLAVACGVALLTGASGAGAQEAERPPVTAEELSAAIQAIKDRLAARREEQPIAPAQDIAAELQAANGQVVELSEHLDAVRVERDQLLDELAELRRRNQELDRSLRSTTAERDRLEQARLELDGRTADVQAERETLAAELDAARSDLAATRAEQARLLAAAAADHRTALAAADARYAQAAQDAQAVAGAQVRELERESEALREVARVSVLEVESLGSQLIEGLGEREELLAIVEELRRSKSLLSDELGAARADALRWAAEARTLRDELRALDTQNLAVGPLKAAPPGPAVEEKVSAEQLALVSLDHAARSGFEGAGGEPRSLDLAAVEPGAGDRVDAASEIFSGLQLDTSQDGWIVLTPAAIDFEIGSAQLTAEARDYIAPLAARIARFAPNELRIVGHTDSEGASSYNRSLSQDRAEAVRGALLDNLADEPGTVAAEGHGEDEPIASNTTREGRRLNRRVEIYLR